MTAGSVHCGPHGGTDERPLGRGGVHARAWPPAALSLGSTSVGVRHREGRVANSLRAYSGARGGEAAG
jgi:hypothetical protein